MTKYTAAPKAKEAAKAADIQAEGLSVYRVFWLFLMASFLGDMIEVAFWLVTRGELVSRSSLVYGPFSLVWGLGAVLLTLVFYRLQDQGNVQIFLLGTALGGVYEYICSWFQEWAFGVCFWDYSHLPFNLNGRINLVFCLFWGAVAVLWVRPHRRYPPPRGQAAGGSHGGVPGGEHRAVRRGAVPHGPAPGWRTRRVRHLPVPG